LKAADLDSIRFHQTISVPSAIAERRVTCAWRRWSHPYKSGFCGHGH
jgi:hypothetical protein